jgi:hypothetical protein
MHRILAAFGLALLTGCGASANLSAEETNMDENGSTGTPASLDASPEAAAVGDARAPESSMLDAATTKGGVGRYTVHEITLDYAEAGLSNVWEDATVSAVFTSPSGKAINVGGFYYAKDTWKIRFAPSELGTYRYHATLSAGGASKTFDGSFDCVGSAERGFIRSSPQNPLRLVFGDGTLYPALGMGSCIGDPSGTGWGLDGGDRSLGEPERTTDIDTYLEAMAGEGKLNIYRWSVNNCAFELWDTIAPSGNRYLAKEGQWGDVLVSKMRQYGLRVYMDFFGWKPMFATAWQDKASMDAVKRYVTYVVARYGASVDFWEVCNESSPPSEWITAVADYVKTIDPYQHMVSSSWERPDLGAIDIASPHWYEKEAELASDTRTVAKIEAMRFAAKPIIFGEQGNSVQNWDPLSALRARIRAWTAFFNEAHLVFWESNFAKDYKAVAANLYFSPDLRTSFGVLQTFTASVPADVAMESLTVAPTDAARAYGLRSSEGLFAYLRDAQDFTSPRSGVTLYVNAAKTGVAKFWDTQTGAILEEKNVGAGQSSLAVPAFTADVALEIRYTKN